MEHGAPSCRAQVPPDVSFTTSHTTCRVCMMPYPPPPEHMDMCAQATWGEWIGHRGTQFYLQITKGCADQSQPIQNPDHPRLLVLPTSRSQPSRTFSPFRFPATPGTLKNMPSHHRGRPQIPTTIHPRIA